MKRLILTLSLALLCGCATIQTRIVEGHVTIDEPYFCTCTAASMCTFIMFTQVLSPEKFEWHWLNIVTVPVGACCFIVDVPFEAVFDTLFYPFDKYKAVQSEKKYQ